jgi:putative tryptophan/tyrosine transport system substrate-binding protein
MQFDQLRRREFVTLLGGAAAWPLTARAQERVKRVGVLLPGSADNPEYQARLAAFHQGLAVLGWTIGRNVHIETRWATSNAAALRKHAAELAELAPDVILTTGTATMGPLLQATRTVPIVFVNVADPVGAGYVDSLARPGGNPTGFTQFEYGISGKWLELLKEVAPGVTRAAVIRDPAISSGLGQWGAIQSVAPSVGVEVSPVNVRDAPEIERAIAAFARSSRGGLIVTASALAAFHRDLLVTLAARGRKCLDVKPLSPRQSGHHCLLELHSACLLRQVILIRNTTGGQTSTLLSAWWVHDCGNQCEQHEWNSASRGLVVVLYRAPRKERAAPFTRRNARHATALFARRAVPVATTKKILTREAPLALLELRKERREARRAPAKA